MKKSPAARLYRRIANIIEPVLPAGLKTPAHYLSRRITHRLEAEYDLLMGMVEPGMIALDAGANIGIYTYGFLARGAHVIAVEPQPACAARIEAFYARGFPRTRQRGSLDVRVEALGRTGGQATLHVPMKYGRVDDESASLRVLRGESVTMEVPVRRLDDYGLTGLHVMKIDVEGHELELIEGAAQTIERCKPIMLVEIEQRHHDLPIAQVFERIHAIIGAGYTTSFLDQQGAFLSLERFDVARDQISLANDLRSRRYVRNFFLLPSRV